MEGKEAHPMITFFNFECSSVVVAAHDGAFFDALILHRDISAGNIIITAEGEGLLIDWDLCINLRNHAVAARQPKRTVRVFSIFFKNC